AAFRPPFGKLTIFSWFAASRLRVPLAWWTADSGDTWPELPNPQSIVDQILPSGTHAGSPSGAVVLLHSHDRGPDRQQYVLQITQLLLARARELHMTVCTMADVLASSPSSAPAHAH
ncbi:MAG TPA: hypothetical protein VG711_07655, partial [Phycisphaerales bacterium]|nr:hypothetical protein [Phycisphaerales bacterium]